METIQIRKQSHGHPFGDPLDAPHLDGIEEFTIKEVENPILVDGKKDVRAAKFLIRRMEKLLLKKARGRERRLRRSSFSRVVMRPKLVAATDQYGRVSMRVEMISSVERIETVAQVLVDEIYRSCGYDMTRSMIVLDRFWVRMVQEDFRAPELMSTLLIVCENVRKEQGWDKREVGGIRPSPMGSLIVKMRNPVDEDKEVNLRFVSIRQMLRYYFEKHPRLYRQIIFELLGVVDEEEIVDLESRIKYEIAKRGLREFVLGIHDMLIKNIEIEQDSEDVDIGVYNRMMSQQEYWDISRDWSKDRLEEQIDTIASMIVAQVERGEL